MTTAYLLHKPAFQQTSAVFTSPHSGRNYTPEFLSESRLDAHDIRSSEDAYVDDLFAGVTQFGAPLLAAVAPRAYVDLNRASDEFDPGLIRGLRRVSTNPRVASGLGVVPRVVAGGRHIYDGKLEISDIQARIETFWHPYHQKMRDLIEETLARFSEAVVVDCHSMPNDAVETSQHMPTPDIVVGDRFGASAAGRITDMIERAFQAQGFRTARNTPFAGAYIAQHYGRPTRRQHAVQVEINRSLYMNEATLEPLAAFRDVKEALLAASSMICSNLRGQNMKIAAE